jgi:hypothetical protein
MGQEGVKSLYSRGAGRAGDSRCRAPVESLLLCRRLIETMPKKPAAKEGIIPLEVVEQKIFVLRGHRVMPIRSGRTGMEDVWF